MPIAQCDSADGMPTACKCFRDLPESTVAVVDKVASGVLPFAEHEDMHGRTCMENQMGSASSWAS